MTTGPSQTLNSPSAPMISCHVLRSILQEIDVSARTLESIFRPEQIAIEDIYKFNARIKLNSYMRIFEALSSFTNDPLLGLRLAEKMGPEMVGAAGYIVLCSPTLEKGLASLVEHLGSIQDATNLEIKTHEDGLSIEYNIISEKIYPRKQDIEFSIGYIYHLTKRYLNGDFTPLEVQFEFERTSALSTYEHFFGCDVFFEQPSNLIFIKTADLSRTSRGFDANLIPILESYLNLSKNIDSRPGSFSDYVGRIVSVSLSNGAVTADAIANRVGLSESKLRHKLKQEGTTFKKLLISKRINMAKRLLMESNASILEIAVRCGYSESASFSRAFSSQTNTTPTQYRAQGKSNL